MCLNPEKQRELGHGHERPTDQASPPLVIGIILILFFVCLLLFFYRLADRDLWSSHEGRAAQDAQTILRTGRWGLPGLFDRKLELQKPPLYYWLVAALAWCRGGPVDAWAVRLPASLTGLGGVLALFWLAWKRGRPVAGLMASAFLGTMMHYVWLARTGRIDMPLTLMVGLALGGYYLGQQRRREQGARAGWRWFCLAYLAVAAALLLKGPIGLILPAVVVAAHLLVEGQLPAPRQGRRWLRLAHELGLWWGVPLVLVLVVPWFWWAGLQTRGELFHKFFLYHNVDRALGSGGLRAHPWWFYGPCLVFDLLPWSLLLPGACWWLWRWRGWQNDSEARFGLVWLVTMFGVLSCAGFKRADYLLPAYPGVALLLGCAAERFVVWSRHPRRLAALVGVVIAGCLAGWLVYLEWVLPRSEHGREDRRFAAEIRRRAGQEQVILFRVEAHALAFHLGPPLDTILEWENLDFWASLPATFYVVMPPDLAGQWHDNLEKGALEPVLSNTELAGGHHQHPLVLMRTRPRNGL